jgi:uncharacterized surface protein with fasciclin (FAS1) repeats
VKPSIRTAGAALVAAALLVTTAACSSTDESSTAPATEATPTADATDTAEEAAGNVVDVAVSAGSFTILTELLTATGLAETLAGPGPFTVFAPTDAAVEATAAERGITVDELTGAYSNPEELLKEILLYHVVPGKISAADMVALNGQTVESLSGETFTVIADGQTVSIKDGFGVAVNVIDADTAASNGVIHVVDTVFHGGGAVR